MQSIGSDLWPSSITFTAVNTRIDRTERTKSPEDASGEHISDYGSLQCSCFEHLRRLQQVKLLDQEKRRCHKFIKHLICVMKLQKKSLISDHVLDFGSSEASSCFWSTWNKSGQRDKYNLLLLLFCFIFNKASLCVADRMRRRKKRKTHADDVLMNLLIRILCENKVTNKHKQGREIKLLWTSCYHLIMRI